MKISFRLSTTVKTRQEFRDLSSKKRGLIPDHLDHPWIPDLPLLRETSECGQNAKSFHDSTMRIFQAGQWSTRDLNIPPRSIPTGEMRQGLCPDPNS